MVALLTPAPIPAAFLPVAAMENTVRDVLSDFTDITHPHQHLGLDELEKIELAATLESEFDIFIPDAKLDFFTSIAEIIEIIRCLTSA